MRQWIARLALKTGVFETVRSAYHHVWNRSYLRYLQQRQAFFVQFIKSGDLVFDVGANKGEFTLMFRRLGARVVSVEPNPALAATLRARFSADSIVEAAVSDSPGQATLFLGSDSNYSTIVADWLPVTRERDRLSDRRVDVAVTTLDRIVADFGNPAFLKIDVEANELPVLRGLHSPVRALMFEYQCPLVDQVVPALDHLTSLGDYEFSLENEGRLSWNSRDALLTQVRTICATGRQSGDVYARLRS